MLPRVTFHHNRVLTLKSLKKNHTMKKLLFVLALGVFAACGNAENKEAATDSTAVAPVTTDSAATATPDSAAATTDSSAAAAPAAH